MFSASKIESGNKTTKATHRRNRKSDFPAIRARCTWRARPREDDGKDDYEREGMKERTDMQIHLSSRNPQGLFYSLQVLVSLFYFLSCFCFLQFLLVDSQVEKKGQEKKEMLWKKCREDREVKDVATMTSIYEGLQGTSFYGNKERTCENERYGYLKAAARTRGRLVRTTECLVILFRGLSL